MKWYQKVQHYSPDLIREKAPPRAEHETQWDPLVHV